jgi:hypothetical protein
MARPRVKRENLVVFGTPRFYYLEHDPSTDDPLQSEVAIKVGVGLALVLLTSVPAFGQEKNPLDHPGCKSYFMTFWADSHIPGGVLAHWEKSQEKWYLGKGVKKFPSVCMDAKKATYLLVYTSEEHTFQVTDFEHVGGGLSGGKPSKIPLQLFTHTQHQRAQETLGWTVFGTMAGFE